MGRIETTVPHLGAYITGGLVEWGRLLLLLDVRHGARIASGVSPARRITLHHVARLVCLHLNLPRLGDASRQ